MKWNGKNGFDFISSVLLEMYKEPDDTIFCKDFEKRHNLGGLNLCVGEFRDRIIEKSMVLHCLFKFEQTAIQIARGIFRSKLVLKLIPEEKISGEKKVEKVEKDRLKKSRKT